MSIYHWLLLASIVFCFIVCLTWFLKLIKPVQDYAVPMGKKIDGVIYSSTIAMLPNHKESAYLHLPTYIGGIIFHIGIFTSIILLILQMIFPNFMHSLPIDAGKMEINFASYFSGLSSWTYVEWLRLIFGVGLIIAALCGIAMIIKRVVNKELRYLSNPDDFISNILVTIFILASAFAMLMPFQPISKKILFIVATILFIYLPFGKLRHFIYFFSARYQLGVFYGTRGVWSMKNKKQQTND